MLALTLGVVVFLRNSRFGLALQAVREDPVSAAMAGVDVVRDARDRLAGFGAGRGSRRRRLSPGTSRCSIPITSSAAISASSPSCSRCSAASPTIIGPIVGVIILYGIYNLIGFTTPQYFQLIYGLLIMGLVLFLPAGPGFAGNAEGLACPLTRAPHPATSTKLVKRFGGFYALDGLSFHVAAGEILGLVGPNGSGKTTAINVISGLYAPDGGEVVLDGARIGGRRVAQAGASRHQPHLPGPEAVPVADGARECRGRAGLWPRRGGAADHGRRCSTNTRLAEVADRPAADLNSAQQKMLDLVRALATASAAVAARRTRRRAQSGGTRLDRRTHQGAGAVGHRRSSSSSI